MEKVETLDLLIVGAGPAGVAAAVEAQRNKLSFLLLEKGPSHSQMIRTYYKEGKRVDAKYAGIDALCFGVMCLRDGNRESYLEMMDYVIKDQKIPLKTNCEVWNLSYAEDTKVFTAKTAQNEVFQSRTVIVAIGRMGKPRQPDYWKSIPNVLKNNKTLLFDINSRALDGAKVLVVGGGDSAAEYAQMLSPKNEVTLCYRKEKFERMNSINRDYLERLIDEKKVRAWLGTEILGVEEVGELPRVLPQENKQEPEVFDAVLFALGGMSPIEFLRTSKVSLDSSGEPVVDKNFETDIPGFYVIGDLLGKGRGGGSIIAGFNSAALAISHLVEKYFGRVSPPAIVSLDHLDF